MSTANFSADGKQKTYEQLLCWSGLTTVPGIQSHLIFISVLNIFLSITAVLGNALILVALHKESSLHPPSKLLLRCLATTDLCVGLISEPINVAYTMSELNGHWNICRFLSAAYYLTGIILCGVSLLTMTAISVDRLLALLLGLRYRQVVTLKRTYMIVITFWIVPAVFSTSYFWNLFVTIGYIHCNFSYITVSSKLNHLLHKDFFHPPPSSSSVTRPGSTTESNKSTEHSAIQKGSVQCTLVANDAGRLLSASWYSGGFVD